MIPTQWKQRDTDTLGVIQISDTHLFADPGQEFGDQNPTHNLDRVLRAIADWKPDMVIATGDLTHDEQAETYQYLRNEFNRLPCPVYVLPGNHDRPELMRQHLVGKNVFYESFTIMGGWSFTFLNSAVEGQEYGRVSLHQLNALLSKARENPTLPMVLALHHQPIEIGSSWMDAIGLKERDRFIQTLIKLPNLKSVIFGHIHQQAEYIKENIQFYGTPATSVQFLPQTQRSQLDPNELPGFRWMLLNPTSAIHSEISRSSV